MTKDIVTISGKDVERIEYRSVPVITLRMMDELHERPDGTARGSFHRHKEKLLEGEDFFAVPYEEWTQILNVENFNDQRESLNVRNSDGQKGGRRGDMTFLTQSGYLMLVKSFTDDLMRSFSKLAGKVFPMTSIRKIAEMMP